MKSTANKMCVNWRKNLWDWQQPLLGVFWIWRSVSVYITHIQCYIGFWMLVSTQCLQLQMLKEVFLHKSTLHISLCYRICRQFFIDPCIVRTFWPTTCERENRILKCDDCHHLLVTVFQLLLPSFYECSTTDTDGMITLWKNVTIWQFVQI